jgi:VanZ like family
MFQALLRILAWTGLVAIAFVTLAPLGLRPVTGLPPDVERFAAFAAVGALFAAAYPRYIVFAGVVVLGAAVSFELLQLLAPTRHGTVMDASIKVAGGLAGLCAVWIACQVPVRR